MRACPTDRLNASTRALRDEHRRLAQYSRALAKWLESHPAVARVYYPGLKSHGQHELAMKQQSGSGAAVVSFDVAGKTPEERRKNAFHDQLALLATFDALRVQPFIQFL